MSNNKKTIKINPDIFIVGGKRNKTKTIKNKSDSLPQISPNILKTKLVSRVINHKKQDIEIKNKITPQPSNVDLNKYSNDFNDSIEYLQMLSNQKRKKKQDDERKNKHDELQKRTVRNTKVYNTSSQLNISLDLPDELKEEMYPSITSPSECVNIKYNIDSAVPYGCLKNGIKKTFRSYHKNPPNLQPIITNNLSTMSEREIKIKRLKDRLQQHQQKINDQQIIKNCKPEVLPQPPCDIISHTTKKIKTTTVKKYILGKSKTDRVVGVLIKDRNTRKRIMNAQKLLKRVPMHIVKKELYAHNLICCGSSAPNELLRKTYETSILAGEIVNDNKEMLIKNLMSSSTEL